MPVVAVQRNARYWPAVFDAYPTITAPVDDVPYAWLELPPSVPGQVTVSVVVPSLAVIEGANAPPPAAGSASRHEQTWTVTLASPSRQGLVSVTAAKTRGE